MKDQEARDKIEKLEKEINRLNELINFKYRVEDYDYSQSYPTTIGHVLTGLLDYLGLDAYIQIPSRHPNVTVKKKQ